MATIMVFFIVGFTLAVLILQLYTSYFSVRDTARLREPEFAAYHRRDCFFSDGEKAFYDVLTEAVKPALIVMAHVRLIDLLQIDGRGARYYSARNKVVSKHVDFVLCEPGSLRPMCVLELDDTSHARSDRKERDAFVDGLLKHVRLPVLHVSASTTYDVHQLRQQIRQTVWR